MVFIVLAQAKGWKTDMLDWCGEGEKMNLHAIQIAQYWKRNPGKFVKINQEKLASLANELKTKNLVIPDWHLPDILPESPKAFVSHTFYICAVDFAFTHFNKDHDQYRLNEKISGSNAMAACFFRKFGENPIPAEAILEITESQSKTKKFFQGLNLPPLIKERRNNLQEAAIVIMKDFNDDPFAILEKNDFYAGKIINCLTRRFPQSFGSDYYIDTYQRPPEMLSLNKRAQLWPLIYQGRAFHSHGWLPTLKNVEAIGPIADYQVPKYLSAVGILEYHPSLVKKIDGRIIIEYGSDEEVEIRLATVTAVCELIKLTDLTMPTLDFFLWSEGQKIKTPHHLTPNSAY